MELMTHPETGEQAWDFTVEVRVRNATRHTRLTHPFRQNRDPEMRDQNWVKKSRARFALIVNEVMIENKVDVRYDPRSYKDMGLDVVPMASISRILADRSKTQPFLVMDADWTRRMIETEMREAAVRRDKTFRQLQHVEEQIEKALRWKRFPRRANALLPPAMRLHPGHIMGSNMGGRISGKLLNLEAVRLATQFLDDATERTLKYVVEATVEIPPAKARVHTPPGSDEPDPAALAILHAAAVEELSAFELSRKSRTGSLLRAGNMLLGSWRREAGTHRAATVPSGPDVCQTDWEVQTAALRSVRNGRISGNKQAMPRKTSLAEQAEAQRFAPPVSGPSARTVREGMTKLVQSLLEDIAPQDIAEAAKQMLAHMKNSVHEAGPASSTQALPPATEELHSKARQTLPANSRLSVTPSPHNEPFMQQTRTGGTSPNFTLKGEPERRVPESAVPVNEVSVPNEEEVGRAHKLARRNRRKAIIARRRDGPGR